MRSRALFYLLLALVSCSDPKRPQEKPRNSIKSSLYIDSLVRNTKWIMYNSGYNDEVPFIDRNIDSGITFGELDYRLDTVEVNGDTTIVVFSPYVKGVKLTGADIHHGYKVGLGYIKNHEMPYFVVNRGYRSFPRKPYNDLSAQLDSTRLNSYFKQHEESIDAWFKEEALTRLRAMRTQ